MIIAVAIDDNSGMTFNNRRQSRDSALCADLLNSATAKLRMNSYSAKLFDENEKIIVSESFLDEAADNDVCFVENVSPTPYIDRAIGLIIYRWNRRYPVQTKFDVDLSQFKLVSSFDFVGTSHEKITKEIYKR